jgi:uncharacterized membrane protein
MTALKLKTTRLDFLDFLRGFTIILMIFFHFSYDLNFFKFVTIDFQESRFWYWLPRLIAGLFLFCSGVSLSIVHGSNIHWKSFNKRLLKITTGAILVSVITYFVYPERWIYFGTLHCLALSSLVAICFIKYPKWGLVFGTLIFLLWYPLNILPMWPKLIRPSLDNIPLIPWVFFVFLGMNSLTFLQKIKIPSFKYQEKLIFLSQHSLKIYLLHQPILLALLFLVWKLTSNA